MFEGTPEHFRWLGDRIADAGLAATGIGVMSGGNPISADAAERRAGIAHLNWLSDCASALRAEVLAGPFHQPLGEFSGAGPTEEELGRLAEAHQAMADRSPALILAVEPLNRFECYVLNTGAQAAAHVARVDRANFGYLYDTFHANIEERDPVGVIGETVKAISYIHISENDRGAPGNGHIDHAAAIRAAKAAGYDGWFAVEAFGQAMPDLAAATKILATPVRQRAGGGGRRRARDPFGVERLRNAGRENMSDEKPARIRLGMVGGGKDAFIGAVHRIAARIDDDYELVAGALSSTPEKSRASGAALGIAPDRVYDDFATMAKREARRKNGIEAVAIVTPNHMHAPAAREFLKRGIHVICDKPLTATLAEAKRLQRSAAETGALFVLTHNYTGYPMIRQARAMIAARHARQDPAWSRPSMRRTGWRRPSRRPARSRPTGAPTRPARAPAARPATSARTPTTSPAS